MHAYTEMLETVVNGITDVYHIKPKDLEFKGYAINAYIWNVNKESLLVLSDFDGTIAFDKDSTILDKDNLQVNVKQFELKSKINDPEMELTLSNVIIAGLIGT